MLFREISHTNSTDEIIQLDTYIQAVGNLNMFNIVRFSKFKNEEILSDRLPGTIQEEASILISLVFLVASFDLCRHVQIDKKLFYKFT